MRLTVAPHAITIAPILEQVVTLKENDEVTLHLKPEENVDDRAAKVHRYVLCNDGASTQLVRSQTRLAHLVC